MWLDYWHLSAHPFLNRDRAYVPTSTHEETIRATLDALDGTGRPVCLTGGAGAGKSTLLAELLRRLKSPRRRVVPLRHNADPTTCLDQLVRHLGGTRSAQPWHDLDQALKVLRLQGLSLTIGCDDVDESAEAETGRWIDRLAAVVGCLSPSVSLILTARQPSPTLDAARVPIPALTRSETFDYLHQKLSTAGCDRMPFTVKAVTRIHAQALGIPGRIESIARQSLTAAARLGLDQITPASLPDSTLLPGWYEGSPLG